MGGWNIVYAAPIISFNWTLLMNMITLLVLFLILKKFFYQKLRSFMEARSQKIQDSFDEAAHVNKLADEALLEYREKIDKIEVERRDLMREAKIQADTRAKEIIDEASERASKMIEQTERDIEREKIAAVADMQEQIAALAILAAEKIIEHKLNEADQHDIINKVIRQLGGL